jgi:MFS family permease
MFFAASLLSNVGTWAQQVAEPWLLVSLGASSFLVGLDSFAMNAPVWALTLLGGLLADRADRRRVIAVFQSIQMLCPLLIAGLLLHGSIRPFVIIVLSFVVGITDALSMPSFQSIVPSIVDRQQIGRGLALNSTQFNLSRILGPAIAGMLMAGGGAIACFALNAASYIPFIGIALWILPRGVSKSRPKDPTNQRPLFAGLQEILGNTHLLGALLTVLVTSVFCGQLVTFSPVLVKAAFHGDASRFSMVVGCFGVGGLLGAIGLLAVPPEQDRRPWSSRPAAGYGLIVVLIALLPWFWGLPVLMVFAGAAHAISSTSANSLLQASASPRLLGQTTSLYMLAMRGGLSLGSLLTGFSIDRFGVKTALLINGTLAVAMQLVIGQFWIRSSLPQDVAAMPKAAL